VKRGTRERCRKGVTSIQVVQKKKLKRDTAIVSMVPVDHLVSPRTFYMFRHRCRIKDIPDTNITLIYLCQFDFP